jgi:organic radical activating enzyme
MLLQILYFLLKEIHLFYIEVLVTTRCSLKCKHCCGYIPLVENKNQQTISFEEYKFYLDNLLQNVKTIRYFRILGGEPLLNKEIDKILLYTLEQKKIRAVLLVTNGTIPITENVVSVLKRFPQKVTVDISNYSANKELQFRLKHNEIVATCKKNNIKVNLPESLFWAQTSSIEYHNRSQRGNKKYYLSCASICVGIHKLGDTAGIFPCIKAGIFKLRGIGDQQEGKDYLSLSNPIEKKEFVRFYRNADFNACKYCNYNEDIKTSVIPGIQFQEEG